MKTYLLIEEDMESVADPLCIEDKEVPMLPCIGDLITVFKSPRQKGGYAPDWKARGVYKATCRSYEIYDMEGSETELNCTLTVERQP